LLKKYTTRRVGKSAFDDEFRRRRLPPVVRRGHHHVERAASDSVRELTIEGISVRTAGLLTAALDCDAPA
jgi:hypothetical protein